MTCAQVGSGNPIACSLACSRNGPRAMTRWSQASERVIGAGGALGMRQKTLPFNGYGKQVAALYAGMDPRKLF